MSESKLAFGVTCCQDCARTAAIKLGTWDDVRQKALNLRRSARVHLAEHDALYTVASVDGDHGQYTIRLYRADDNSGQIITWSCTCPWGYWAWRRQHQYVGRCCSHALAVFYETRTLEQTWADPVEYQTSPQQLGLE